MGQEYFDMPGLYNEWLDQETTQFVNAVGRPGLGMGPGETWRRKLAAYCTDADRFPLVGVLYH